MNVLGTADKLVNSANCVAVKRKNLKRTIQIQSAVTDPSLTPEINKALAKKIEEFKAKTQIPADITIKQTGEGEQQAETSAFLGTALISALLIIFLILVLQFNSLSKPKPLWVHHTH